MAHPIFDELSFQNFEKIKSSKIVSFRKSKNSQIQKVDFFFEKSMSPLKDCRIFLRSFLVPDDRDRSDSVFFRTWDNAAAERSEVRAKRGPSEARSERSEVRNETLLTAFYSGGHILSRETGVSCAYKQHAQNFKRPFTLKVRPSRL